MASIQEIGEGKWLARVRKRGIKASKVFPSRADAEAWATTTEAAVHVVTRDPLAEIAEMRRARWESLDPAELPQFTLDGFCGVYFLFFEGELIYVGQSLNVPQRVEQHIYAMSFDRWSWIPVHRQQLDQAEQYLIRKFKPRNNQSHNPASRARGATVLLQAPPEPAPILTS